MVRPCFHARDKLGAPEHFGAGLFGAGLFGARRLVAMPLVAIAVSIFALIMATDVASASEPSAQRSVEVIELSGPLDRRAIAFAISSIESAAEVGDVEVVILQIDSPGVVAAEDDFRDLYALVADPPLPLVTWLGPTSARAFGGAAQLLAAAPLRLAAPGSRVGWWAPTIAGERESALLGEPPSAVLLGPPITIDEPVMGLVDLVSVETAAPRQLIQLLDGLEVGDGTLKTVEPIEDGVTTLPVVFREPGFLDRILRLSATPEAAFFFLVAGLTVAAFEFYAIGPGIAAFVAAASLLVAAPGLGTLSVRWWALILTLFATWLLSISYQRGGVIGLSAVGLALLAVAGFGFTATAPQIRPSVAGVLLTVAAAAFFFLLAMPTVARSRFSTQTIGRDRLIGARGRAIDDLDPDGMVEIDGARWRATSHRQANIRPGDEVSVLALEGWVLDVEPFGRENES